MDETLAVGDVFSTQKCFQRLREITDAGTTFLFVSHSMAAVQNLVSAAGTWQFGVTLLPLAAGEEHLLTFRLELAVQSGESTFSFGCSEPAQESSNQGYIHDWHEGPGPLRFRQADAFIRCGPAAYGGEAVASSPRTPTADRTPGTRCCAPLPCQPWLNAYPDNGVARCDTGG